MEFYYSLALYIALSINLRAVLGQRGLLRITHSHGSEGTHTHVDIHLDKDYVNRECSVEGSVCVPLSHCPLMCKLFPSQNLQIRQFLKDLNCGFHADEAMVCCPLPDVTELRSCDLDNISTTREQIDLEEIIARLAGNYTSSNQPITCGENHGGEERIYGGENAAPGEWPWMAMLWYTDQTKGPEMFNGCGGTVISRQHILTAAHCIQLEKHVKLVKVRLGETDLAQDHDCTLEANCVCPDVCEYSEDRACFLAGACAPKHQDYEILQTIPHPGYKKKAGQFVNDIALVKLKREVSFSSYVRPVCLPDLSDPQLALGASTGWGNTNTEFGQSELPDILQQVAVRLVERQDCEDRWSLVLEDPASQVCVEGSEGGGLCQGDSGGPLVHGVRAVFVQVAVLSAGSPHCGDPKPTFYCPVDQSKVNWIKQTIQEPLAVRPS